MRYRLVLEIPGEGAPEGGVLEVPCFAALSMFEIVSGPSRGPLVPGHVTRWVGQDQVPVWIPAGAAAAFRAEHPATVFTCHRCGATSWHPEDRAQGYCGACHDFVGHG